MFPLKPIGVCIYITGQVCDIRFLTRSWVIGGGFIISANIDDLKAIQVHAEQPLMEGLSCYKLSRDSYYIREYPYSLYISKSLFFKKSLETKEKNAASGIWTRDL